LAFSRNWSLASGELGLEAYAGRTSRRRAQQGGSSPGELHTRSGGVVLAYRHEDDVWRMGWQRSRIRVDGIERRATRTAAGRQRHCARCAAGRRQ
jgi:hypothetical protein